jgi:hypothetical protein
LLRTTGLQYNLGALATPYFAMPRLTTKQQTATDIFGNPVTYKVGEVVNPVSGIDYNRFVAENMIPIQSMIQSQINAGRSAPVYASPKEVLEDQFGKDEKLWPVTVDDNGTVIPKQGTGGKSWLETLSNVDRQRVIANLRPFISIDDQTQNAINLRHAASLKAIEAQREDFEARRAQIFKNAETKYEVQNRPATSTAAASAPEFLIARDTYKATLGDVSDGIAADEVMASALAKVQAPDEIASLFNSDPNAINVPQKILAAFYSQRASRSKSLLAKQRSTVAGTAQQIAAKTYALDTVRTIATAETKKAIIDFINKSPEYSDGKNAKQFDAITNWVNSQ